MRWRRTPILGDVIFYPATEGGIAQTFHHQNCNVEIYSDRPWRKGRLCVDTNLRALGRQGYDIELFEAGQRLRWHFSRVLEWLSEASRGRLALPGDPFELPHFPHSSKGIVAFAEDSESFQLWRRVQQRRGLVGLVSVNAGSRDLYTQEFSTLDGSNLVKPSWGQVLSDPGEGKSTGAWIAVDGSPSHRALAGTDHVGLSEGGVPAARYGSG